ncbi:hypothetical protein, partial [Achromobacter ruhlandii]|uniref:hypothetical protein n=1 Tax=Achromobacter ruhlandii TaxID=72557 RepID=UPI003B9EF1BD
MPRRRGADGESLRPAHPVNTSRIRKTDPHTTSASRGAMSGCNERVQHPNRPNKKAFDPRSKAFPFVLLATMPRIVSHRFLPSQSPDHHQA